MRRKDGEQRRRERQALSEQERMRDGLLDKPARQ
jgi:hypothetical protein